MQSSNARMPMSGMANSDDGTCWETVLRFLSTPTPADYSFEFDHGRMIEEEGQPFEENLVVDEYLFKQPQCVPRQPIYSKSQKFEWKQLGDVARSDGKTTNPGKFLKLTELEMVQSLRRWKETTHEPIAHPVAIKEADVYALHPADLTSGNHNSCTHYFYSSTKYSCLKRPTRLRITENGCRWKQQGRIFPIRESGQTVGYKTYLSYVALKNGHNLPSKNMLPASVTAIDTSTNKDMVCKRRDRKWSLWTMEEIGLAEDIQSERVVLRRGGRPRPFPVICRIVCKRDGITSAPLQARLRCKKPTFKRESPHVAEPKPCDVDVSAAVSNTEPAINEVSCPAASDTVQTFSELSWPAGSTSASIILQGTPATVQDILEDELMRARKFLQRVPATVQDILEDDIIRALIYELPYGKIRTSSTTW